MLKISLAQINVTVGDMAANTARIFHAIEAAAKAGEELIVFPELSLCGYPPEDLLLKPHFIDNNLKQLNALARKVHGIAAIVGFVDSDASGKIFNAAALLEDGKVVGVYHKRELPNYGVFDEKRYFSPGNNDGLFKIQGTSIGINICEDIWVEGSIYKQQVKAGAELIVNLSSSPFELGKLKLRESLLIKRAKEVKVPIVYVNLVGGQDELVFDGGSMMVDASGKLTARARQFEESNLTAQSGIASLLDEDEEIYQALVLGTRDYVLKNGFTKVALGLSGGIDSALVAAIAVDALGKDNVTAISMPTQFNAKATRNDAKRLAKNLGILFHEIPIEKIYKQYLKTLKPYFNGMPANNAEENLQARIRGQILMAFSNKFNGMILTTGNKSEMAVGYCTLYGDMSGGFAPLKDIFKTKVYSLSRWRNTQSKEEFIPKSILLRAPSAELRPNQTDEASLGAYEDLDAVLAKYIQEHRSGGEIAIGALSLSYVAKTMRLVDINEYKRRQAPPGIKITARAFGKDWRLPITNKYKE